jgi:oligoribonuclease (3'-5' exoribonuclease)
MALCGAERWTLRKVDQKYLERFEKWCWRRMEKIGWTDRVRNEVLHRVKEERNILHTIKRRKANWIGHMLRRNCLLKHVI